MTTSLAAPTVGRRVGDGRAVLGGERLGAARACG
jgi:hypothetical protein